MLTWIAVIIPVSYYVTRVLRLNDCQSFVCIYHGFYYIVHFSCLGYKLFNE